MSAQQDLVQASRLRALLYFALVISAMAALFGIEEIQTRVLQGTLAPEWRLVPAAAFSVALMLYAVDRVLLVRRGRYPSGKAFFQVAFGLVLLTFLLPGGLRDYQRGRESARTDDHVEALMLHSDPRVRAAAAELAGRREDGQHYLRGLVGLLNDRTPMVRDAAREALERRTGRTMGTGEEATQKWKSYVDTLLAAQEQGGP